MFTGLRLHGAQGSILWGHRPAAVLTTWTIAKVQGAWKLTATIAHVDRFQARQTPLLFTAPKAGGFWAWPVESLQVGSSQLVAQLGPPEQ